MQIQEFASDPMRFLAAKAKEGQPAHIFRFLHKRFVFFYSREAAEHILVKHTRNYPHHPTIFRRIRPVTGRRGLVQLPLEESRAVRSSALALFQGEALGAISESVRRAAQENLREISSHRQVDIGRAMNHLVMQTALEIFLGAREKALVERFANKFFRLNELCGFHMRRLLPLAGFFPLREKLERMRLETELRAMVAGFLESQPGNIQGIANAFRDSPDRVDQVLTFLFAGHETSSASIAFTLLLLGQEPALQDKIAAGDEALLLAVYKESLRLYSPAYMLVREARTRDSIHGIPVKPGDSIVIALQAMHRGERAFPEADQFRPERFLGQAGRSKSFLPFGLGPRACVGERIAYLEAKIIIQEFCRHFQFRRTQNAIRSIPLITQQPQGSQFLELDPRGEYVG